MILWVYYIIWAPARLPIVGGGGGGGGRWCYQGAQADRVWILSRVWINLKFLGPPQKFPPCVWQYVCVYIRNIWYNLQYDEVRESDVYHWPVDFNQRGRVHHLVTKTEQAEHAHFIIRIYNHERKLDQNTKNSKIYKRVRVTVCMRVCRFVRVYYDKNFVYWINKGFLPIKYYVEFISSSNKQQVCLYRSAHLCVCVCAVYFSAFIQS